MGRTTRQQRSEQAVDVGLLANIVLAVCKTAVGIIGHSSALLADGINSTSDVVYYVVVKVFTRLAGKPPDREHPYGHRQMESIAAVVVGAFVVATGAAIFWDAVDTVYTLITNGTETAIKTGLCLAVALGTVLLKIALTVWTRRIGRSTGSPAIAALAADHKNDIAAAAAAAVGILLAYLGWPWVDPLAGAVVALFVLWTGLEILRDSSRDLLYVVPGDAISSTIGKVVRAVPGVRAVEEVHTHRFGPYMIINLCIGVDGNIPVVQGDRIASKVEEALYQRFELLKRVYVHFHPVNGESD